MTKITADHALAQSANPMTAKVEQLRALFPNAVTEAGLIDFEVLKELLANHTEGDEDLDGLNERYQFTWAGKTRARREASKTSTATLRPDHAESKDWDNTENIFIEGDNLEVLKLLQKSYNDKVKLIYIDPPYNTGNDFVYPDDYKDNLKNYLQMTGQLDGDGKKMSTNADTSGRYHSNWLNMMYPRLVLARELLTEDGVIFISIDDNEVHNLRKICDEVFGEENFVAEVIWRKKYGIQNDAKYFSVSHEYVVVYAKQIENLEFNLMPRTHEQIQRYKNPDNDSRGPWKSSDLSVGRLTEKDRYKIITPSGREIFPPQGRSWVLSESKFYEFVKDNRIWFGSDGNSVPSVKKFLSEVKNGVTVTTFWDYSEVGHTDGSNKALKELFNDKQLFDYPKPIDLLKTISLISTYKDSLILDFFAGSGTTAHAVMQLNAEDGGNRKFICVQLPEPTPEDSEARKAGYKTISAITRERIRRAGEKIVAAQKEKATKDGDLFSEGDAPKLDIGFRAYKLDSTNVITWDPDPARFSTDLLFDEVIKQGRTDHDLMVELSLKLGLPLITKTETRTVASVPIHCINDGLVFFALAKTTQPGAAAEIAAAVAGWWRELNPYNSTVVFRDALFATDEEKLNALLTIENESDEYHQVKLLTI